MGGNAPVLTLRCMQVEVNCVPLADEQKHTLGASHLTVLGLKSDPPPEREQPGGQKLHLIKWTSLKWSSPLKGEAAPPAFSDPELPDESAPSEP